MSPFNFLVKLMHLKVMHKCTNQSFDMLDNLLKMSRPEQNKVPVHTTMRRRSCEKLVLGTSQSMCANMFVYCFRRRKQLVKLARCVLFWKMSVHEQAQASPSQQRGSSQPSVSFEEFQAL